MRVFVFSAMEEELEGLKSELVYEEISFSSFKFYKTKYLNNELILGVSGVGRCNASMFMQALNDFFLLTKDDVLINIGCAGAIAPLKTKDILVGKSYCYGDVDLRIAGPYQYGQMSHCPFAFTSDKDTYERLLSITNSQRNISIQSNELFMTDYDKIMNLLSSYFFDIKVYAFDMEAAAYAQCAYRLGLRFCSVKYISDVVGDPNQKEEYLKNNEKEDRPSHIVLKDIIIKYLNNL